VRTQKSLAISIFAGGIFYWLANFDGLTWLVNLGAIYSARGRSHSAEFSGLRRERAEPGPLCMPGLSSKRQLVTINSAPALAIYVYTWWEYARHVIQHAAAAAVVYSPWMISGTTSSVTAPLCALHMSHKPGERARCQTPIASYSQHHNRQLNDRQTPIRTCISPHQESQNLCRRAQKFYHFV